MALPIARSCEPSRHFIFVRSVSDVSASAVLPRAIQEREVASVLARDAKLSVEVARKELERTNFDSSAIGAPQREVMLAAGGVLGKAGVIKADVDVGATVSSLIEPRFVQKVLGH